MCHAKDYAPWLTKMLVFYTEGEMAYDKFQQLVFDAEFPVAIFGDLARAEYQLIALGTPGGPPEDFTRRIQEHRLSFIGTVGIVLGAPRTALEIPLDAAATDALATAYLAHIEARMTDALEVRALLHLYGIPTERDN